MTNLTISLNESIVRSARMRAIAEGTSVSAKVREFLAQYAQELPSRQQGQGFLDVARQSRANSEGAKWIREDAYDRPYPNLSSETSSHRQVSP
jgi:plasmid stability protein